MKCCRTRLRFVTSLRMPPIGLIGEELTGSAIGAFFAVYDALGSGFVEHIYAEALTRELRRRGHRVAREVPVPVFYRGEKIALQRLDVLVDSRLVVEVKASPDTFSAGKRQLFNYLRATRLEIGLLFTFGPKPEFNRVVCRNAVKVQHD